MKIIEYIIIRQPDVIPKLKFMGYEPFIEPEEEPDPTFDYFDKLMREVPRK